MSNVPTFIGFSPGDHGCGRTLTWLIQGAVEGGMTSLILREPHLSRAAYVELARRVSPLFGPGLILHASHPDARELAQRSGWGLHLPATVGWAGVRPGVSGLLGMSCHSIEDLHRAEELGADYATLSPIFGPLSNPDDCSAALGIERLAAACAAVKLPVIAMGGLTSDTAPQAASTGCHGIGSMGHVFPEEADADLTEERARGLIAAFSGSR
ncbi:MAG: thiamine phosphate synthase [Myxococcota bacterium]|nr:thiamine phosphate synthase [Myxococcota bacterium]MEC9388533.1 thiamine phosphate synthase [Myxococcota bacterium]